MKLQGKIIITLPDFIKYFTCGEFWQNREIFVRDMQPDRVYYWDPADERIYEKISAWIKDEENKEKEKEGLNALSMWVGKTITMSMLSPKINGNVSLKENVVCLQSGKEYILPKFDAKTIGQSAFTISLHKLVFNGEENVPIKVSLGDTMHIYHPGDAVYITVINEACVEILDNCGENDFYNLQLINQPEEFGAKLIVKNLRSGNTQELNDVTSFALFESGFVYVRGGEIKCHNIPSNNMLITFFKMSPKPIYTKQATDNEVIVLYANGELKKSGYETDQNYHGTAIDGFGNILKI